MSERQLKASYRTPTSTDFWRRFRPFSLRIDEYGFDHWYLFTIGPYVVLLLLDMILQIRYFKGISLSRFSTLKYGLSNWIVLSTVIALSLTALAFNRWRRQIPKTLQGLFDRGRIMPVSNDRDLSQEYRHFLEDYHLVLHSRKRFLLVGGLMIMTLGLTLPPIFPAIAFYAKSDLIRSIGVTLENVLAPLLWAYFSGTGAWVLGVTGVYLRKLTTKFTLHIQPSHPDGCGGLRPLGNFCLGMAYPILIGAVFLSIFGLGGVLDKDAPITFAANVGLFVFALPLATLAFLAPLWNVHREMAEQRRKYEDEFANRVAKLEEKIPAFLDKGEVENARNAKEELEIIGILHPNKMGYPEWPFDRGILLRFFTPQIVPIISLVVSISDPLTEAIRSAITILANP